MGRKNDTYGRDFGGPTLARLIGSVAGYTARYGSLVLPQGLQPEGAQLSEGESVADGAFFGGVADHVPAELFDLAWNVKELRWDYSFSSTAGSASGSRVLVRGQDLVIDQAGESYTGTAATGSDMTRSRGSLTLDEWGASVDLYENIGEEDETQLSHVDVIVVAVPRWHYLASESATYQLGWWLDLTGSVRLTESGTSTAGFGTIGTTPDAALTMLDSGVIRWEMGLGPAITASMALTVESRFSDWAIPP